MDPFGSHIQSMAASLLAAESTAHVRPWPAFKTRTDRRGRGWGGGRAVLSHCCDRICDRVDNLQKTEAGRRISDGAQLT